MSFNKNTLYGIIQVIFCICTALYSFKHPTPITLILNCPGRLHYVRFIVEHAEGNIQAHTVRCATIVLSPGSPDSQYPCQWPVWPRMSALIGAGAAMGPSGARVVGGQGEKRGELGGMWAWICLYGICLFLSLTLGPPSSWNPYPENTVSGPVAPPDPLFCVEQACV